VEGDCWVRIYGHADMGCTTTLLIFEMNFETAVHEFWMMSERRLHAVCITNVERHARSAWFIEGRRLRQLWSLGVVVRGRSCEGCD
jgi:hypothetical protein